ncbi:CsbD family protein, partial [Methylobacterium sp. GC_Met_2]|uniref:CsbD family protein n=1 Tax=Methylobacterium sp. GC_Met_2 TaxID=2937376 RepID=UPI00226BAFD0
GGKVQGAVGDLTGSQRDSAEGRAREASGKAENLYGQAKDTVRDAAGQVADTARDLGGRLRETVGGLVGTDDIEDRARHAQGAAEDHFDRARRSVRRAADDASDYAEDAYERGSRALRHGNGGVSGQVAEYPLASLLIAGAVGFGLALLVNANRD